MSIRVWRSHWRCRFAADRGKVVQSQRSFFTSATTQSLQFTCNTGQKKKILTWTPICMPRGHFVSSFCIPAQFTLHSLWPIHPSPKCTHRHSLMMPLMAMFKTGMSTEKKKPVFLYWMPRNLCFTLVLFTWIHYTLEENTLFSHSFSHFTEHWKLMLYREMRRVVVSSSQVNKRSHWQLLKVEETASFHCPNITMMSWISLSL